MLSVNTQYRYEKFDHGLPGQNGICTVFGLKMMVKIGLEKIFLKFLHAEAIFF